ncbi:adenylate cyclase [Acrasis kona]|uniref:Adenylate cyclase n=1 Tax=Acrasis kona TaxID=1008807 RepID=A0AAW2Z1Z9_9EUKA
MYAPDDNVSLSSYATRKGEKNETSVNVWFAFIYSLRLKIHPLFNNLIILLIEFQFLLITPGVRSNWGPTFEQIFTYSQIPRSLGLQYLPDVGQMVLSVLFLLIYVIIIFLTFVAFRCFLNGSSAFDHVKRIAIVLLTIACITPYLPITTAFSFINCDYNTGYNSSGFQCWEMPYLIFAIISYMLCVLQILTVAAFGYLLTDLNLPTRFAIFSSSSATVLLIDFALNVIYVVIALMVTMVPWVRGALHFAFNILMAVYLFYNVPFYKRLTNSVYCGFVFSRAAGAMLSMITSIINTSRNDTTGIITGSITIGVMILFFFVGFIIFEIYCHTFIHITSKYFDYLCDPTQSNINKVNLNNICRFTKFSIYTQQGFHRFEKIINLAALNNMESYHLYNIVASYYISIRDEHHATMYIQRALGCSSTLYSKIINLERSIELDRMLGDRKRIYKLSDQGRKMQDDLHKNIKYFFKTLASENAEFEKLNSHAELAYKSEAECDHIFGTLYSQIRNQSKRVANVMPNTSKKSRRILEEANFLYAKAEEVEEIAMHKARQRDQMLMDTVSVNEDMNPILEVTNMNDYPSPPTNNPAVDAFNGKRNNGGGNKRLRSSSVAPVTNSTTPVDELHPYRNSDRINKKRNTLETLEIDPEIFRNEVEMSDTSGMISEGQKRRDATRKQILVENKHIIKRLMICMLPFVAAACVIMCSTVTNDNLIFVDTERLLESCIIQPIPYIVVNHWRQHIVNNGDADELRSAFSDASEFIRSFRDNVFNTKMSTSSVRYKNLMVNKWTVAIPVLSGDQFSFTNTNMSLYDFSGTLRDYIDYAQSMADGELKTTLNIAYAFFYYNRQNIRMGFHQYCLDFKNEYYNSDTSKSKVLIAVFISIFAVHILYFVFLFVPSVISLNDSRTKVLELYKKYIPKDVVGSTYQNLKKKKLEDTKINSSKTYPFLWKVGALTLIIMFLELVALGICSVSISLLYNCDKGTSTVFYNYGEFYQSTSRLQFILQEILIPDTYINLNVNLPLNIEPYTSDVNANWALLRFGSEGLYGSFGAVDDLVTKSTCNNTGSNQACSSLDRLLTNYQIISLIAYTGKNNTNVTTLALVNNNFDIFQTISNKTGEAVMMYQDISHSTCAVPYPPELLFIFIFALVFVALIFLFYECDKFIKVTHRIRTMLQYIPQHNLDGIEELKSFVMTHNTSVKKKEALKTGQGDKLAAALEACNDAAIICTHDGTIQEVNSSAIKMFSYEQAEFVGRNIREFFIGSEISEILVQIVDHNTKASKELSGVKKTKEEFPVKVNLGVTHFGKATVVMCFCSDLTLEKKQRDLIAQEKLNNEKLLQSILPAHVSSRLKKKDNNIADRIESCTVFFSDMVGFTSISSNMSATNLVKLLNSIVNTLDDLCKHHSIEKIKTIGDAYFCVGGLTPGDNTHAERVVQFAVDALKAVHNVTSNSVEIRIGIHTGPLIAGVIGKSKFAYDCWGDTVNIASRMESTGIPGKIQITRDTYERVHDLFSFEERDGVVVKGKGTMTTYILSGEMTSKEHIPNLSEDDEAYQERRRSNTLSTPMTELFTGMM